jgi:hypothetical protein
MLKIAFALQIAVVAAFGLSTTHSTASEQKSPDPVLSRASCSACDEVYDNCIAEGITPAGCRRMTANCYKNCLP